MTHKTPPIGGGEQRTPSASAGGGAKQPDAADESRSRVRRLLPSRWRVLLGVLGPGLIAANAGNDAGAIATYGSVGARYGYELLWVIFLCTFSLIVVQEMVARLGAVTGKGLSDLIREEFSLRWTVFAMFAALIANGSVTISEFAGIAAALELFGIPRLLGVPVVTLALWWIIVAGSSERVERIFVTLTLFFFAFIMSAIMARPDWGAALRSTVIPTAHWDAQKLMLVVATVGTTVTPFMQFILQSSVVERGVTIRRYKQQLQDVILGSTFANVVVFFIIVCTAATLHRAGKLDPGSAADIAQALRPLGMGQIGTYIFGLGLFGASITAAAMVPLSTAFSISEAFGWESGVNNTFREAPVFYTLFSVLMGIGMIVGMWPGLPMVSLLVAIAALNGMLLPVLLVFIMRLINNRELMGDYVNRPLANFIGWGTVVGVSLLDVIFLASTVWPK
jgi:NRAMP (natural resistance-associated macrophage protein)-like metal ion transporter